MLAAAEGGADDVSRDGSDLSGRLRARGDGRRARGADGRRIRRRVVGADDGAQDDRRGRGRGGGEEGPPPDGRARGERRRPGRLLELRHPRARAGGGPPASSLRESSSAPARPRDRDRPPVAVSSAVVVAAVVVGSVVDAAWRVGLRRRGRCRCRCGRRRRRARRRPVGRARAASSSHGRRLRGRRGAPSLARRRRRRFAGDLSREPRDPKPMATTGIASRRGRRRSQLLGRTPARATTSVRASTPCLHRTDGRRLDRGEGGRAVSAAGRARQRSGRAGEGLVRWAGDPRPWASPRRVPRRGSRRERDPPGQHLEKDDAERVDVGRRRGGLARRLLGRHVGGGAEHGAGLGQLGVAVADAIPKSPSFASRRRRRGRWPASGRGGRRRARARGRARPRDLAGDAPVSASGMEGRRRARRSARVPPPTSSRTRHRHLRLAHVEDAETARVVERRERSRSRSKRWGSRRGPAA